MAPPEYDIRAAIDAANVLYTAAEFAAGEQNSPLADACRHAARRMVELAGRLAEDAQADPAVYAPTAHAPASVPLDGPVSVTEDDGDADTPISVEAEDGECVMCHERRPLNRSGRCGPCDATIPY